MWQLWGCHRGSSSDRIVLHRHYQHHTCAFYTWTCSPTSQEEDVAPDSVAPKKNVNKPQLSGSKRLPFVLVSNMPFFYNCYMTTATSNVGGRWWCRTLLSDVLQHLWPWAFDLACLLGAAGTVSMHDAVWTWSLELAESTLTEHVNASQFWLCCFISTQWCEGNSQKRHRVNMQGSFWLTTCFSAPGTH